LFPSVRVRVVERRENDEVRRATRLGQAAQHGEAVHLRHANVEEDDIWCHRRNEAQSLCPVGGLADNIDVR
jgi:hypothetical protein